MPLSASNSTVTSDILLLSSSDDHHEGPTEIGLSFQVYFLDLNSSAGAQTSLVENKETDYSTADTLSLRLAYSHTTNTGLILL